MCSTRGSSSLPSLSPSFYLLSLCSFRAMGLNERHPKERAYFLYECLSTSNSFFSHGLRLHSVPCPDQYGRILQVLQVAVLKIELQLGLSERCPKQGKCRLHRQGITSPCGPVKRHLQRGREHCCVRAVRRHKVGRSGNPRHD